jgi:hypothetical protein
MLETKQSHPSASPSKPQQLSAGYARLQDVDQRLLEAEQQLKVAHHDFARRQGPRPDSIYTEVLRLRKQARLMLDQLADLFLGDDLRGTRQVSAMNSTL